MHKVGVLVALFLLTGCVSNLPPALLLPKTVDIAPEPITSQALGTVNVRLAPKDVERHLAASSFQVALKEVLKRSNLFGDDTVHPFTLDATVEKASFPGAGTTMTSDLDVRYVCKDFDGRVIMSELVSYTGVATFGDEFFGSARALLAFQRANEGHFTLLVSKLRNALKASVMVTVPR